MGNPMPNAKSCNSLIKSVYKYRKNAETIKREDRSQESGVRRGMSFGRE
jgi:hypothetical protein